MSILMPDDEISPKNTGDIAKKKILVLACGALAQEIVTLKQSLGLDNLLDIACLPANLHNYPHKIAPMLEEKINKHGNDYDHILIGYADCGTGGDIDRAMKGARQNFPNLTLERLEGAHCYAFYKGQAEFAELAEEVLGTFYLTDYLARFFDHLIIKGMGLDRFPQLKSQIFAHYTRLVYLSQTHDEILEEKAKKAAAFLELDYEHIHTGYGELGSFIESAKTLQNHPNKPNG